MRQVGQHPKFTTHQNNQLPPLTWREDVENNRFPPLGRDAFDQPGRFLIASASAAQFLVTLALVALTGEVEETWVPVPVQALGENRQGG